MRRSRRWSTSWPRGGSSDGRPIWAIGEIADGKPTRLTLELATLARRLADAAGAEAHTLLVGPGGGAAAAAAEWRRTEPTSWPWSCRGRGRRPRRPRSRALAPLLAERKPDVVLIGATPDGKDLAGALIGLTDLPILVNGSGVAWSDGGPHVEMSTFGGRLVTRSAFTAAARHRAGAAVVGDRGGGSKPGKRGAGHGERRRELRRSRVTEPVSRQAPAASIEEARVIVGGGRGVGQRGRLRLIQDSRPTPSAERSGRRARSSTPAGSATASRSARPARSSSRRSTSRAASAAPSSTRSASRPRARSWPSTRTRTRRSPSSPTWS